MGVDMGQVNGQDARDVAIYRAWVDGARQVDLAEQHGVSQQAISQAVGRVLDHLPAPDKAQEVRRSLDLVDDLLGVYIPRARAGTAWANREVRGLLALRGRYLGIDRREVDVHGQVDHVHHLVPEVAQLVEWRQTENARIRAEAQRLSQDLTIAHSLPLEPGAVAELDQLDAREQTRQRIERDQAHDVAGSTGGSAGLPSTRPPPRPSPPGDHAQGLDVPDDGALDQRSAPFSGAPPPTTPVQNETIDPITDYLRTHPDPPDDAWS